MNTIFYIQPLLSIIIDNIDTLIIISFSTILISLGILTYIHLASRGLGKKFMDLLGGVAVVTTVITTTRPAINEVKKTIKETKDYIKKEDVADTSKGDSNSNGNSNKK